MYLMRGSLLPPFVYHPSYSCAWPSAHRFPMWKFKDLHSTLSSLGLVTPSNLHMPRSDPPHEWFTAVHDPDYYEAFLEGALEPAAARRIGFNEEMRKDGLILRTRLEVSGTIKTVQLALEHGLAANLAGGTHHAHASFGSGFTILNDMAVAARWAQRETAARKIAIVDLDVHQGDGTATIFQGDDSVFTFSMHCGTNFPFRKAESDLDIDVPKGTADRAYLAMLRDALPSLLAAQRPDLVIYDAGVDPYEGDQLGHLKLSHAGLYQRDLYVIESCVQRQIPIACVIGGGYDRDRRALARRHALVHRACAKVWTRRRQLQLQGAGAAERDTHDS